jgi:hypothetical protein
VDSLINIKWKTSIPGLGHSCPVIWDNYLFVTTAVSEKPDESLKVGLYGDIDMASGIASDGKVYFSSETGKIYVIQTGPVYKLISVNKMNDVCMATPALSGNVIFFRTQHYVVAVE